MSSQRDWPLTVQLDLPTLAVPVVVLAFFGQLAPRFMQNLFSPVVALLRMLPA